jgi:hypothetical protein
MYDIIHLAFLVPPRYHTKTMISYYDIIFFVMISCSISQKHTVLAFLAPIVIDNTHDITAEIMKKSYDIKIT